MPTVAGFVEEAKAALMAGDADRAVAVCRHLLTYCPKHIEASCLLAEALRDLGETAPARELYLKVVSADPTNLIAHWALGLIAEAEHDRDWAAWELLRAWESGPEHLELRKEVERLTGTKPSLTAFGLAQAYAAGGLFDKAAEELERLLADEPDRLDVRVALAENLWRAGRQDEAARACETILEDSPDCLKANLLLGAWLYGSADRAEERERGSTLLGRARELDPAGTVAADLLGGQVPDVLTAELPEVPPLSAEAEPTLGHADEAAQAVAQGQRQAMLAVAGDGRVGRLEPVPPELMPGGLPPASTDLANWLQATEGGSAVQKALEARLSQQAAEPPLAAEPRAIDDLDPEWRALLDLDIQFDKASEDRLSQALAEMGLAHSGSTEAGWLEVPTASSLPHPRLSDVTRGSAPEERSVSPSPPGRPELPPPLGQPAPANHAGVGARAELESAVGLWHGGNLDRALEVYRQLLTTAPELADEVVAGLRGLIAANPGFHAAHRTLGDAYMRAGRFQQAIDEYNWVLANRPNDREPPG